MQQHGQQNGKGDYYRSQRFGGMNWYARSHGRGRGSFRGNSSLYSHTFSGRPSIAAGWQADEGTQANDCNISYLQPSTQYQSNNDDNSSFNMSATPFVQGAAAPGSSLASPHEEVPQVPDVLQESSPAAITQTPRSSSMPGSPRTPATAPSTLLTNPYNTPLNGSPKGGPPAAPSSSLKPPLPISLPADVFAKMTGPELGALQKTITSYADILSEHTIQPLELLNTLGKKFHVASEHEKQYQYQQVCASDEAIQVLELAFRDEEPEKRDERLKEATDLMKKATYSSRKAMEFQQEVEKTRAQMEAVRMAEYNVVVDVFQSFIKDLKHALDMCKGKVDEGENENENEKETDVKIVGESREVGDMTTEGGEDHLETAARKKMDVKDIHTHKNDQIETKDSSLEEEIKMKNFSDDNKKARINGNKATQANTTSEENKVCGNGDQKSKSKSNKWSRKNKNRQSGSKNSSTSGVSDATRESDRTKPVEG